MPTASPGGALDDLPLHHILLNTVEGTGPAQDPRSGPIRGRGRAGGGGSRRRRQQAARIRGWRCGQLSYPVHEKRVLTRKMERTGSNGWTRDNIDIFIGRSYLLGLLYRYLLTEHGWKDTRVHKNLCEGIDATELFRGMEVTTN